MKIPIAMKKEECTLAFYPRSFSCVNSRYFAKVPYNIKTSNKVLCKMPDIEIFPDYDYLYPKEILFVKALSILALILFRVLSN